MGRSLRVPSHFGGRRVSPFTFGACAAVALVPVAACVLGSGTVPFRSIAVLAAAGAAGAGWRWQRRREVLEPASVGKTSVDARGPNGSAIDDDVGAGAAVSTPLTRPTAGSKPDIHRSTCTGKYCCARAQGRGGTREF